MCLFSVNNGVIVVVPLLSKATGLLFIIGCMMLFSYNRLGKDADEADAEEIIDMASKASAAEQQKQVQENIHSQITSFCMSMDKILLPDIAEKDDESSVQSNATPRRSGLSFAVGKSAKPTDSLGEFSSDCFSAL